MPLISHQCRVCFNKLPQAPLLQFENMPKAAQFLPDLDSLHDDQGVNLDVYQCPACGLVQIDNEPVHYYKEVVRAAAFSDEMKTFRRSQFVNFVQRFNLVGKKMLEVGCGRGEYLTLLQEAGVSAFGLEYADNSVNDCIHNHLNVTRGFVDSPIYSLPGAPFDAFAAFNFLEHWPDPCISLRGIAHNLHEGGIGLVEVPNFDMILKKNLFTEFIGDHIFYFTRETLETTLRLNGFEILDINEIWYDYIISATVRKRSVCNVSTFDNTRRHLKQEIDDFIHDFGSNGVAIWGAGHQALATISLLGLARKIRYVVDSAPFKQNKFTPASHIPIVAPSRLEADPVGAIIVMAASYSDEVARTIRNMFSGGIKVAIMRDFGLEGA